MFKNLFDFNSSVFHKGVARKRPFKLKTKNSNRIFNRFSISVEANVKSLDERFVSN